MRKPLFSLLLTLILLLASSTGINAQTDTLLIEDFNGTTLPSGWDTCRWIAGSSVTASTTATTLANYRWKSNTGGVGSSRCAYLYAYQSYTLQHGLMTPARLLGSTDRYKLCFDLKNYTTTSTTATNIGGDLDVLITLDNGTTISDTIALGINTGKDWVHYEYQIPSALAGQAIRFIFLGKAYHYYYLDNVVICEASQCRPVIDAYASSITESGAQLNWSIGNPVFGDEQTPQNVIVTVYKSDSTLVLTQTVNATVSYLNLTSLDQNTEYFAEIVSDCGLSGTGNAAVIEFKTLTPALAVPYYLDFDCDSIPSNCFTYNATHLSTGGHNAKAMKLTATANAGAYFLTPMLNVNANNVEVNLWVKPSAAGKTIKFGYSNDPSSTDYFTEVLQFTTGTANQWQEVRFNTSALSDTTMPVMIGMMLDAGVAFNVTFDEIDVHQIPTCTRPENLTVTDYTANDVTLDWSMANATNVRIYAMNPTDSSILATALATSHPYTMTGLTAETDYLFAVRGICSATDSSDISTGVTVKTRCAVAASTLFFEGAEGTTGSALPDCWTTDHINKVTTVTNPPFYTGTTTKKDTRGFALRSMTAGNISYLCSQALNFDSLGKYSFRYEYYRPAGTTAANNGEGLKVFVTPTPGDTVNAVEVISFVNRLAGLSPIGTTGWNTYEGIINYQGTGYIMIVGYSQNKSASYFDNLQVILTPNCPKVTDVTDGVATANTYSIGWTAGDEETQWSVKYQLKQGTTTIKDTTEILSATQLMVQNLQPATAYVLTGEIRAICGAGDTAEAVSFSRSFTTACLALNSLPYTNDFESEATGGTTTRTAPTCWSQFNDATSTYIGYPYVYSSTTYFHSGSKGLYFYTTTTASYAEHQMAILPEVDVTVYPVNTLRLKFWAKRSTTTTYADAPMIIGVMTNPADLTTFVPVDTVLVNQTTHQEYITRLDSYTGNGSFIAIRLDRQTAVCYCYLDDVTLEEIPSCIDLTGSATVSDITESSVKITLADQTAASAWSYAIGAAGTPVAQMPAYDATGANIVLTGLASATNYDIYVRRNCGNGNYSPWSAKVTFATTATPATAPYSCSFEDATENANWMIVPGSNATNKFAIGTATTRTGLQSIYVSADNGTTNSYTIGSCATRTYAYRTVHFDAKGYQIEFYWQCPGGEGTTTVYDYGRVMLLPVSEPIIGGANTSMSSTNAGGFPANAIFLDPDTANNLHLANPGWHFISKFVNFTAAPGNYNLVLAWNNDGSSGTQPPLSIDDITITELSCIPPVAITPSISSTSATLTVSQPGSTQWEFVVDTVAFTKAAVPAAPLALISSTDGTATITGLTPNREYWYSVRTICGAGDTSAWLEVASLRTFCASYSTPYTEGFESEAAALCWTAMADESGNASVERATAQHHSGSASLKAVKAIVVSPEYTVDSLTHYMVNGYVYSTTDSAKIFVGVVVDPNDLFTLEKFTTVNIPVKNTWTEFTAYFTALLDPGNADFKYAKHIAIDCGGDNTVYFDDIDVELAPTCPKPNGVNITNITTNSFDISFTDNASASQWVVFTNGTPHVINSTSATISGLTAHTEYSVGVAAICSATDTSAVTDCGSVTTACDKMPTPWTCGFEATEGYVGGSSHNATTNLTVNAENNCWNVLNNRPATSTSGYPYAYVYTTAAGIHSGSQGTYMYSSTSGNNLCLIFPEFSDPSNMMKVNFWYKNSSTTTTYPQLKFGYFTDPTTDTSFVAVEALARLSAWTEKEYFTNTASYNIPANARLGLLIQRGTAAGTVYVDDISVTLIRNCSDPEVPTVSNITATTADVTFTDTCASHTAWEYVYGPSGFNPNTATPVSIDTTVFTISGLNDDSNYEVYVRAVCGVGDESNYVKASFRTLCAPFYVTSANPFSEDFNSYNYNQYMNSGTCYSFLNEPASNSYWAKAYPTATPSATATTYYFYGHSADRYDKSLYWYIYKDQFTNGTILRQFHLDGDTTYEISAWVRNSTTTSYQSKVSGMMGATTASLDTMASIIVDGATIALRPVEGVNTYCYNELYQQLKFFVTPDSTGDYFIGYNVAINNASNYTYLYLDDWTVRTFSGCSPAPAVVDSVTAHEAYITIDDSDYYQLEYVLNDTTLAPTVLSTTSFVLNNLDAATAYTIYVRKYCAANIYSEWYPTSFRTECGPIQSLPYTNDFENENTGTGAAFVNCWTRFNDATSTYTYYPYNYSSSTYSHSGTKSLYFYTTTTTTYAAHEMAILPEVDTTAYPINTLRLKFWAKRSTTTSYADAPMMIGVMTDPTDLSTFVPVETVLVDNTVHQQFKVSLANYTGNGTYIAIRLDRQSAVCYCYLDDVTLEEIPACEGPEVAPTFVSSTMTTLTVSADMAGKDTIEFGIAPAVGAISPVSIDTTVISTDGTACFTGLTGSTNYAIWYRYYCGVYGVSAWSTAYAAGTTTASDCFAPQSLQTVGIINDHHVAITWGKAPDAVAYAYELRSGNTLVDSVVVPVATMGDTIVYDSLTANTQYVFRARTYCANDTSDWQILSFKTTYPTYTLPFVCGFEDATINSGWQYRTLSATATNEFTIGNGVSASGSNALYVSNDGSTYQYTIASAASVSDAEILLEIPAGNYYVSYDWQCKGESSFDYGRFFLLPSTVTLSSSATYSTYNTTLPAGAISLEPNGARLNLVDDWTSYSGIVNVPATNVYKLVALWANDASSGTQPPFAIDNILIEEVSCMPLNSVSMLAINSTNAMAVASRYDSTAVEYACSRYDVEDSLVWNVAASDTLSLTGLVPASTYYLYARHACDSATKSPVKRVSFVTPANPVLLPFVATFESNDTINSHWVLTSGAAASYFTIGSATSDAGSQSLYVTDDGSSYHYSSPLSWSYAYVPVQFNAGTFDVTYRWACHGESTFDYGRIFLVPSSMTPVDNTQFSGMTASALPTGAIALDGTKLNSTDSLNFVWYDGSAEVTFENGGTYNLVVAWHNDASIFHQGPLAIDNITIREQTCKSVAGVNYSATTTTARLKARHTNDSTARIFWHVATDGTYTDTVAMAVTDSVINVTGLNPGSRYYVKVAVVCNGNDTSRSKSYYFRTACDTIRQFPYFEGFEDYASGLADTIWYRDACWNIAKTSASAYSYPSNTASYVHSGSNGLYVYNYSTSGSQQYLALPDMQNLNGKTISFWHKAYSTTSTYATLSFGYTTTGSDFVNLQTFTNKVTDWREHTQVLNNIPAGARLVFKVDGTYYYYIDDIRINDVATTPAVYNDTICFNAAYNNHGISFDAGALFPGDTTISTIVRSVTPGIADSTMIVNIHVRQEIATIAYDTICANTSIYVWGADTIHNPTGTAIHRQRFTAACGCDSTVALNLTVLPESVDINRTICQGDSLVIGDTALYYQGFYVLYYQTAQGCTITANVNLVVEDSVQVTSAAICEGSSYTFQGGSYSQPGIYRVPTTSAAGCTVIKELHLTVYPTDSTIVTSFCQGGSITIAQEVITHDTVFTKTIVNPGVGCSTTYHVTATTDAPVPHHVYDNACEGYLYTGYGLVGLYVDHDTVCYVTSRTADGLCDSVTAVNIKYNLTAYGSETAVMPASGSYTWHDRTLQAPGTYTDTLYNQSAANCDSIVTLTLTGGTGFDYVSKVQVTLVPNPVTAGATSFVYVDAEVSEVEVLNSFGQVVDTFVPSGYPIEVSGISASGIYYVRLQLTNGNVAVEKLIVK